MFEWGGTHFKGQVGAPTEWMCFQSPDKLHYLIKGTQSIPALPDQTGQADTLGDRQSLK